MSGFIKTNKDGSLFSETVSSGIKSLDSLIEIVPGSVTCFYEDKFSSIHNTLLQVFISSCSNAKKEFFILAKEEKFKVKFNKYDKPVVDSPVADSLVIAWRYKNLDLSTPQFSWDLLNKIEIDEKSCLNDLQALITKLKCNKPGFFAIFSIFSPLYEKESINQVLYDIKKYARLNNHTVVMSFPNFLFNSNYTPYFDTILSIVNNLSLPQETTLYNSFIETLKISKPGSLLINNLESFKYGLILKSKKIQIERIDVQPEEVVPRGSSCGVEF